MALDRQTSINFSIYAKGVVVDDMDFEFTEGRTDLGF
jgi:hypothetical protein